MESWQAVAQVTKQKGVWVWGGRVERNSVSDAEQLLCLLYPSAEVDGFSLDKPDSVPDDVLKVLRPLGEGREIAMQVLTAIEDYLEEYADADGNPLFGGGGYIRTAKPGGEVSDEQERLDITESFSISITLCLAAKSFAREFGRSLTRPELRQRIDAIAQSIDQRLTAAMVGLLRSFVISVVEKDSVAELTLLRTVSQGGVPGRTMLDNLKNSLAPVRAKLPDLTYGQAEVRELVDYPERLFEVGWTWGVADRAPKVDLAAGATVVKQDDGVAESRPNLHFTVNAIDGLIDLFSTRTTRLGLLTAEQQPLREALAVRWDLALQYWSTIARFGDEKWPLEDVPWQATDGQSSAYFSLLILAVVVQDLSNAKGRTPDEPLTRAAIVLEELAQRGRINRRAEPGDRGITLHVPGVEFPLRGAENVGTVDSGVLWAATDYAALLAKTALRAAGITNARRTRTRLLDVGDDAIEHLMRRRLTVAASQSIGLWDDPGAVFPDLETASTAPSWNMTERAMEVLVAAAAVLQAPPVADSGLAERARAMLAEADHLLGQELLSAPSDPGSRIYKLLKQLQLSLARAASLVAGRPGTASAIAEQVLRELDELASARQDVGRSL